MNSAARVLFVFFMLVSAALAEPPIRPDPQLTPGAVLDVTPQDICTPGYSKKVRNVPAAVKRQAYARYGIASHEPGEYEVDHLISLELGGSNSITNLWPQSFRTQPWNAYVKDRVENKLHDMVCKGQIDLKTAQREIAADWIAAYKKYVGPQPAVGSAGPKAKRVAASTSPSAVRTVPSAPPASSRVRVWVNTRSGLFFHSESRYYGKTKQGQFMSESEALGRGFRAAQGQ